MKEDFKLMEEGLIKERDKLLRKHPDLIKFQLEIDEILARMESKDPALRASKLTKMLISKMLTELLPANDELRKLQERIQALEDAA